MVRGGRVGCCLLKCVQRDSMYNLAHWLCGATGGG